MSNDSETPSKKSTWKLLQKHPVLGPAILALLVLSGISVFAFKHWIFPFIEHNVFAFCATSVLWLLVGVVSTTISLYVFKSSIANKLGDDNNEAQKKWEEALGQLHGAARVIQEDSKRMRDEHVNALAATNSKVQQELKAFAEEKVAFHAECERIRGNLKEQERQFYDMVEDEHDWLYNHEQILELEANTDSEILVLAPDFFYERQPQYEDVIVQNLLKPAVPTYEYFVPASS